MTTQGIYVVNRQGFFLAPGRPERKHERVRWVRTREEAGACDRWVEAHDRVMKLHSMNPLNFVEPDIVDEHGAVLTPERARIENRYHSKSVQP